MTTMTLEQIAARIPNGCKLAIPKDDSGVSMAATAALVARGVRNLHIVCVPTSGMQTEWLLHSGAIETLETSAITLREFGGAPRFLQAVKTGTIRLLDATCPAVYAGMQASQKGLPFMPLRGILDSDLLDARDDWRVIDNPFGEADPIVAIKAIDPDVTLFHAQAADRFGNVFVGRDRDGLLLAHAARQAFVTVETIVEGNLLDDPARSGAVVPAMYVDGIAHVPQGAWPLGFGDHYPDNADLLATYSAAARDPKACEAWWQDCVAKAPWAALLATADTPA
ncbi:MAG: CoA-transferase [Burkholderiaceae bacterium]